MSTGEVKPTSPPPAPPAPVISADRLVPRLQQHLQQAEEMARGYQEMISCTKVLLELHPELADSTAPLHELLRQVLHPTHAPTSNPGTL